MAEISWEDIQQVNGEIKTTELKGKQYAEVKERVIAFRKLYPQGFIKTDMVEYNKDEIIFKAEAYAKGNSGMLDKIILATGYAREKTNKAFSLENCETSAIGRCLGFLGLGISTSIASADEMKNVEDAKTFDTPTPADIKSLAEEFSTLFDKKKQAEILNGYGVLKPEDMDAVVLEKYITKKKNEIETNKGKGNQPGN